MPSTTGAEMVGSSLSTPTLSTSVSSGRPTIKVNRLAQRNAERGIIGGTDGPTSSNSGTCLPLREKNYRANSQRANSTPYLTKLTSGGGNLRSGEKFRSKRDVVSYLRQRGLNDKNIRSWNIGDRKYTALGFKVMLNHILRTVEAWRRVNATGNATKAAERRGVLLSQMRKVRTDVGARKAPKNARAVSAIEEVNV